MATYLHFSVIEQRSCQSKWKIMSTQIPFRLLKSFMENAEDDSEHISELWCGSWSRKHARYHEILAQAEMDWPVPRYLCCSVSFRQTLKDLYFPLVTPRRKTPPGAEWVSRVKCFLGKLEVWLENFVYQSFHRLSECLLISWWKWKQTKVCV